MIRSLMPAGMSDQHITILVKHLIVKKFRRKHLLLVHGDLSFAHKYACLMWVHVYIDFKYSLLQLLNHSNVCLLEIPDAKLYDFELPSYLFQKASLLFSE
jgi:hypothetical protein